VRIKLVLSEFKMFESGDISIFRKKELDTEDVSYFQ